MEWFGWAIVIVGATWLGLVLIAEYRESADAIPDGWNFAEPCGTCEQPRNCYCACPDCPGIDGTGADGR